MVRAALLGHPGAYADALALVELGEADASAGAEELAGALEKCGIDDARFAQAAAQALVWTDQVLAGNG